jgi:hypothetical protein
VSGVARRFQFWHTARIQCGQVLGISMRPFAHAFTAKAKEPARSECMVKGPFCVLGLGMPLKRRNTILGMSRTRKDAAQTASTSKSTVRAMTRMQGLCGSARRRNQPMDLPALRRGIEDSNPSRWVWASHARKH